MKAKQKKPVMITIAADQVTDARIAIKRTIAWLERRGEYEMADWARKIYFRRPMNRRGQFIEGVQ